MRFDSPAEMECHGSGGGGGGDRLAASLAESIGESFPMDGSMSRGEADSSVLSVSLTEEGY